MKIRVLIIALYLPFYLFAQPSQVSEFQEQLKKTARNWIQKRTKERNLQRLSAQILAIDSTNAVVHQYLGEQAAASYFKFRRLIHIPKFNRTRFTNRNLAPDRLATPDERFTSIQTPFGEQIDVKPPFVRNPYPVDASQILALDSYENSDLFDLSQLEAQGLRWIIDLRAQAFYKKAFYHFEIVLQQEPNTWASYQSMLRLVMRDDWGLTARLLAEAKRRIPTHAEIEDLENLSNMVLNQSIIAELGLRAYANLHFNSLGNDFKKVILNHGLPKDELQFTFVQPIAKISYLDTDVLQGHSIDRDPTKLLNLDSVFHPEEDAKTYLIWYYDTYKIVFLREHPNAEFQLYSPSALEIGLGYIDPVLNDYRLKD